MSAGLGSPVGEGEGDKAVLMDGADFARLRPRWPASAPSDALLTSLPCGHSSCPVSS